MYSPQIILEASLNGLMTGAVYALIALGLTLIYGVLHIINFAHGALLTCAMFAVWIAWAVLGMDPYLAILPLVPLMFALGYGLQRFVIGPASHGDDSNILLVTLGLSIVLENVLLALFQYYRLGIRAEGGAGNAIVFATVTCLSALVCLAGALADAPGPVLIDCLGTWLTRLLDT